MKRKFLLGSALLPILVSGAMAQVVSFHDANNNAPISPTVGIGNDYDELFAGQGAYSDPGNNIWNGYGDWNNSMYGSTYIYSASPGSGVWPEPSGNPGNPYAAYTGSGGSWISSTGPNLFDFATGSPTASGNSDSSGHWTPVTLTVGGYSGDNGNPAGNGLTVPNGTPGFLLVTTAYKNGASPTEVFTLNNVPPGTYGLYLYGANYDNNRGTIFSVNSGNAHNGIAATLNGQDGSPAPAFVEGQNYVIFENVTPDSNGHITITANPNPADGVGNSNLAGETDVNGFQLVFNPLPTATASTAAQNVLAGGTANFSFSPTFASSPSFHWQFVHGGVTNNLTDGSGISGSATTNLTITGVTTANVGLYQCVIATATATNTSPAAPLSILTSTASTLLATGDSVANPGLILQPGDLITDFGNIVGPPYNSVPPPFQMTVPKAVDGSLVQYLNFGANGSTAPFIGPVGFVVTPGVGATVATGLRFFTSGSHPEDDPADYLLEGSDDGTNFTTITGGLLAMPAQRNAAGGVINITNQVLKEIVFTNTTAYTSYRLTITNVTDDATASNGVQFAEFQLIGTFPLLPPTITLEPNASDTILAGATFHIPVGVAGPGPLTYKWYLGSTLIPGATTDTLTIPNVQAANEGTYSVVISNPYGSVTSSSLVLTVVAPSVYEKNLLTLAPLAYWPLTELSGTNAFDEVGGYNGSYQGGVTLGQPGIPTPSFGTPSYSSLFDGVSGYVDIPEGPFNITSSVTLLTWVNVGTIAPGRFDGLFGHGDSSYRTSVDASGQPGGANSGDTGDATATGSIADGNWHMVAYSYNAASNSGALYVDGVDVANNTYTGASAGNALDLWIGGAPDYGTGRLLPGNIAHAAIFTNALTGAQIAGLFDSGGIPPIVTLVTNEVYVNEGGSVSIAASAVGTPPITYSWYYTAGGIAVPITATTPGYSGVTSNILTLTNVQAIDATYSYYVVASNAAGSATNGPATVDVFTGSPSFPPGGDISPLQASVPVGIPFTFSTSVQGTEPFTYAWYHGGTLVPGATNSTYSFLTLAGDNTYYVVIGNVDGSLTSSTATITGLTAAPPVIGFNGDGTGWSLNTAGATPILTNDVLQLTFDANNENDSAFYLTPQYIGGFLATFTYTATGGADGATFCIQNSSAGPTIVGGGGNELGYTGIYPSAAFEINLYTDDNGPGINYGTNGATGAVGESGSTAPLFTGTSPVILASGDPINVRLFYNGSTLDVTMTDATNGNSYATSFAVGSLPATVGGSTAYIGFTGATGGVAANQWISNFAFSYSTAPNISVTKGSTAGTVIVSWPVSVSTAFALEESSSVKGPWTVVTTPPTIVNGENQITVSTAGTESAFYQLVLQ